jgi:serine/threonine protein kinase
MINIVQPDSILQNRYQIKGYIAKGAMGAVYRAFDNRLKCNVAIKQQLLEHEDFTIKLFRREAELLANLKHTGLPKVTDFFLDEDNYFLVMDLVEGDDLQTTIKQGQRLTYEQGIFFFEQLLDILDYLHSHRIIHSDIKPANLKIDENLNLKLIDFGIAKGSFGQITSDVDAIGGTPLYMSLEQTEYGQASKLQVTEKSDLYSACATFYHLLTGQPPVSAFQRFLGYTKNGVDPLKFITDLNPEIPKSVAEVFHQGMELFPENRIATAFELKEILQRKKIEKYRKYTKWSSLPKDYNLTKISNIPDKEGVIPLISTNESGDTEIVLSLIDKTPFIYELARLRPFTLNHKSILYQTSHGFLVCELFYFLHPNDPKQMFAGFESYINLFNPSLLTIHLQLSRQSHWHLFLINADNEVVDLFEFENCYDLEDTLNLAIKLTRNAPRGDFMKAKQEFMDTFTMEDLFQM